MAVVIGIDPGTKGGYAFFGKDRRFHAFTFKDFDRTKEHLAPLRDFSPKVVVEQVSSTPNMGCKSAFTFGNNVGRWQQFIEDTFGEKPEYVLPGIWQAPYRPLDPQYTKRKRRLKKVAAHLFPDVSVTLDNCDALLICKYGVDKANKQK